MRSLEPAPANARSQPYPAGCERPANSVCKGTTAAGKPCRSWKTYGHGNYCDKHDYCKRHDGREVP